MNANAELLRLRISEFPDGRRYAFQTSRDDRGRFFSGSAEKADGRILEIS